jgi:flavin-dependent dehydrogenase
MKIEECVILGGGVASLSAAIQLADGGLKPLVIEAGTYPSHRICGEYFSHECLPILHRWRIPLTAHISHCRFLNGSNLVEFPLPIPAASCSRFDFDLALLEQAKEKGARTLTGTALISINLPKQKNNPYELTLSNGQTLKAQNLIVGMGRLPKMTPLNTERPLKYAGFKCHWEGIDIDDCIEMHVFQEGYLGLARINATTTNIACLVNQEALPDSHPPEIFIQKLLETKFLKKRLSNARMIFPQWLFGRLPEFGIRTNPSWERVFWIGDAAGSIPPVSGEGLAIAITSGCMAADYLLSSNAQEFKKAWLKRYKNRFFWAQQLHKALLNPYLRPLTAKICHVFPSLPPFLWRLTREG